MQLLNEKLQEDLDFIKRNLTSTSFDSEIKTANFAGGNLPDYTNDYQVAYYMLKYAKYYALEYYWMYDLALQVLESNRGNRNAAVTYSFGCGSQIDALSFLYAHNKLRSRIATYLGFETLYYRGIDKCRWSDKGLLDLSGITDPCFNYKEDFLEIGMVDFWRSMSNFMGNVLFFPKLLSEGLDQAIGGQPIIDSFCDNICNANILSDSIVLCISYRGINTYDEDSENANKVIESLQNKGYHITDYSLDAFDWICGDYFDLVDDPMKVFKSKDGVNIDYSNAEYSVFDIDNDTNDYLTKGDIRKKCREFSNAESRYSGPNNPSPKQVCDQGCINSSGCRFIPRKNINSGKDHTCFQILLFTKEGN